MENNKTAKNKPVCSVKGVVLVSKNSKGKRLTGICPYISVTENNCGAHGDYKCPFKVIDGGDNETKTA